MNAPSSKPICDTDPSRRGGIDDGWIEWSGGKRAIGAQRKVHVKLRGDVDSERDGARALPADCYCWSHDGSASDIIAYRVVKP